MKTDTNATSECYVRVDGRLAKYRRPATVELWDDRWRALGEQGLRRVLRRGAPMGARGSFFRKWLPRSGTILEAGCGTGIWVRRLRDRRYQCIGLDYGMDALIRSQHVAPDLPLVAGSVFDLPMADDTLAAYVSLGVIEHYRDGPESVLREAYRALKSGGVALLSVPYENTYRRAVAAVAERQAQSENLEFYQYYFTVTSLQQACENVGLRPQETAVYRHGTALGLREYAPRLMRFVERGPFYSIWGQAVDLLPMLPAYLAHELYIVALKP